MPTDEQLVDDSLNGDRHAFAELVRRYQDRLLRFLVTRAASRADAEDAVQDAFVSAYRYLPSFNPRWRFSTWLYRIALRNLSRQASRSTGNQDLQDVEAKAVDENDPLSACIVASDRENTWLIARRILSADAYTALWLRYVEDLSIREISRALDKTQSWTKVTLLRARRQLKPELDQGVSAAAGSASYG